MGSLKDFIKKRYAHPLADSLDLDSPEAVGVHKRLIRENPLLVKHYTFVYAYFKRIEESLFGMGLPSLEMGSGAGFLKEFIPDCITSDVVASEGIDRVEDAHHLSFGDGTLKAIYALGVIHHVTEPMRALAEVERVLAPGGMLVCNEPSSTLFGYFMNRHFHNEHTDRSVKKWDAAGGGPAGRLTQANMALPYIIFKRDRRLFEERFKKLKIRSVVYHDFLRYTLSGGLSYRPFVPPWSFCLVNMMEVLAGPLMPVLGNNMLVTIQKNRLSRGCGTPWMIH